MKTVAVVPVKNLSQAKTRLAGILSPDERALLALDMLSHVLASLTQSSAIDGIAVISPQPDELHLPPDIIPLAQARHGLNSLLEQGREWAVKEEADALLILFADLPLLTASDISRIVQLGWRETTVVLAPDRHGSGTNAMLAHPPGLTRFAFGPSSFEVHQDLAQEAGAYIEIYCSPGTALDIDTPDDLAQLEARLIAT